MQFGADGRRAVAARRTRIRGAVLAGLMLCGIAAVANWRGPDMPRRATPTTGPQRANSVPRGSQDGTSGHLRSPRAAGEPVLGAPGFTLDTYGGINEAPSPKGATGFWRLEKFGNRWSLVDPAGNAFFMLGIEGVNAEDNKNAMGVSYRTTVAAKYGDANAPNWGPEQIRRLRAWGFNATGPYSGPYASPAHKEAGLWPGDHYNPEKMPFINYTLRPSYYGMRNSAGYIPEPVKNFVFGINSTYDKNWNPPEGEADYYDPKLYTYLDGQLDKDGQMSDLNDPTNPYRNWLVAVVTDEADQTFSFNIGPDFPTYPGTGRNHAHGGYRVAICSPVQTANSSKSALYADTVVYNKQAWRDYLKGLAKYQTGGVADIAKLNAAWSSNYTTWDSSGTAVKGEAIGTGNGSALTFSKTLAQTTISKFTLQILVAGTPVGGDTGAGSIWGPHLSGSINYATGVLTLTFASGYAPASGAAVAANYAANGWGIGTGLLDEDGRHTTWMGTESVYLTGANANFKADADEFLYQMAKYYFQTGKARTLAHFNSLIPGWNPIYLGPNALCYRNTPPHRSVLRAAGETLDALIITGYPLPQERLDFIYQYAGDKPLLNLMYYTANADSAMWRYPDNSAAQVYPTQGARAQGYQDALLRAGDPPGLLTATYTANGSYPYIGNLWWKYLDTPGEQANWGVVTLSDNAYDGAESVYTDGNFSRTVSCSVPTNAYLCGGEERNYGNFTGPASITHATTKQLFCQQAGGCR